MIAPKNTNAERAVLAWCLFEQGAHDYCASRLSDLAFELPQHRVIWSAIATAAKKRRTTKLYAVVDALESAGQIEAAGGLAYVQGLFDSHASGKVAETYAKRLGAALRRREYVSALLAEAARSGHGGDDDDFVEQSIARLTAMAKSPTSDALLVPIKDCVVEAVEHIQGMAAGTIGRGVPSGIAKLDDMTGSFRGGQLIVIAARTSVGKTAFAATTSVAAARKGLPVALFSLEMSRADVAFRFLAAEGEIDLGRLRNAQMTDGEKARFNESYPRVSAMPVKVFGGNAMVSSDIDLGGIKTLARGFRAEHSGKSEGLIVVDYLQLIQATGADEKKRHEVVGSFSRGLKLLSMELDWPVIALSQLNREADKRDRPKLSDLRESGSIEQDADAVILLHRPNKDGTTTGQSGKKSDDFWNRSNKGDQSVPDPNFTEIIVAKNRNGALGIVEAHYRSECALFVDSKSSNEWGY